jgi:hypothetical protein
MKQKYKKKPCDTIGINSTINIKLTDILNLLFLMFLLPQSSYNTRQFVLEYAIMKATIQELKTTIRSMWVFSHN